MTLNLKEVASGLGFPEGPVAMDDGSVLFVDIKDKNLSRLCPKGTVTKIVDIPGGPNGTAIGPDGAAYICNNGAVYTFVPFGPDPYGNPKVYVPSPERPDFKGGCVQRVDLDTGELTTLYTECDGKRLLAPDDIVFDKAGGFWFTETGVEDPDSLAKGGLYYAKIDGSSIEKVATIPMANGVGLSPDGKTVYVSDTVFGRVWGMDIADMDAKGPAKIKPGPLPGMPGRVIQTLQEYQWLDSLKIEADGKICVGTIFNGGITVFGLDGKTEHLMVPDLFTTNLCFGGDDMQDVWITASSTGKIYKTRWANPGLKLNFTA